MCRCAVTPRGETPILQRGEMAPGKGMVLQGWRGRPAGLLRGYPTGVNGVGGGVPTLCPPCLASLVRPPRWKVPACRKGTRSTGRCRRDLGNP